MSRARALAFVFCLVAGTGAWAQEGADPSGAKPAPGAKAPTRSAPPIANEKQPPAAREEPAPKTRSEPVPLPARTPPPAKETADTDPPSRTPPSAESPAREEHVIYVPYTNLLDVFENKDASVVLPYAQFLQMWNRLAGDKPQPAAPPVAAVITRASYTGSVRGERAHLVATLDVEVLASGWARLPVEFGDAAIRSASARDGQVLIRGVGEGRYELLVHGPGKQQIKLDLVVGVASDAEGRRFSLQCPAVGVSDLELEIPEPELAVQVTPRCTVEVESQEESATRLRAVLGSTSQFAVSWQPQSGSTDQATGLANVTDTIAVDVGEGIVHTHAIFDYQILRGSLDTLIVEVPAGQRLLDVQVPGLRDWQTEAADDRQRVTVRLHAPATGEVRLELHTEAPIAEQAFQVGQLRAVGVARESGILAVRSAEDVGLEYVQREAITRVDAADVPESLRKPRSTFYRFFTPDHKLAVVAAELTPRIVVDSQLSILLDKARLTTHGKFQYDVSRSGVFTLTVRLPAGFQVDDVQADAMDRFEVTPGEDTQTLTIYLTKKLLGELIVTVRASQVRDTPAGPLRLPLLEPSDATRERGLVAVLAPESLEVKTDRTQLQSARAATPAELAAEGFEPDIPAGSTLAAAFSFVTRPVNIEQMITERPRRTTVTVGTVANVREDVVQVTTRLDYQIQFAGTDTFRIAVPAAVSERLQISGDSVKERRRAEQAGEDEMVEWTVVLHSETLGDFALTATYDQRISIPDEGTRLELRPLQALDADREMGEISIQKDRVLSVTATSSGLEEIDPRQLAQPIRGTQPYLAYRYYQHPTRLALSVTKHELQEVVETIVRRAYIEAVVTEDGPVTMRARYDLKSSERQRLAMTLRDPRILGITVAGQSVAPEKAPTAPGGGAEDKTYLINVARTGGTDEPFQIAAVVETSLPEKQLGVTNFLRLPLPRFDEGVKFQQVYVRVWVPKEYRLVGEPPGFTSHIGVGLWDSRRITRAPDNPDDWFPEDSSSFDFQVGGTTYLFSSLSGPAELTVDYWHIPTMTIIASLLVLAIGTLLLWCSLEMKVVAVLLAAFGALFAGLFWPSVVNSWLLAARLGIAGVLAVWLIAWLLHVRRSGAMQAFFSRPALAGPAPAGGAPAGAPAPSAAPDAAAPDAPQHGSGDRKGGRDDQ